MFLKNNSKNSEKQFLKKRRKNVEWILLHEIQKFLIQIQLSMYNIFKYYNRINMGANFTKKISKEELRMNSFFRYFICNLKLES